MDEKDMEKVRNDFLSAAKRALTAGFDVLEMHNAHGYLLQSFLSPIANQREDQYGGTLENRMRFPLSVAKVLRDFWPKDKPMFVRISSVDGIEGGFTIEEAVGYAKELKKLGVDVIDCSSGGQPGKMTLRAALGYQVPFARQIKQEADIQTMAVGMIIDAHQANEIVADGSADFVALAREALNDPHWFFHAEQELGQAPAEAPFSEWPVQYSFWLGKRKHTLDRLNAAAVK
jgi:2,4-dienoyl-CoA reductase-like NADH-dependent reductase (Old Yellow Enzyme family)